MSEKRNLYPNDLYSNSKKTTTLAVADGLVINGVSDNGTISPYSVYDDRMSRITFTIISKNNGKTIYPSANISEKEIHGIIARSKAAENASVFISLPIISQMFQAIKEVKNISKRAVDGIEYVYGKLVGKEVEKQNKNTNKLPEDFGKKASSVQILNGEFKGKTPIQVLAENKDNIGKLQSQYNWLGQNIAKYPKNQDQMDAIKEAIYMHENNLLNESATNEVLETGQIQLYEPVPKALIRKKDPKTGLCPVYEISISRMLGDKYPINIKVDNYQAPVKEYENGTLNPDRSKAVNREVATHRLSEAEWFNLIYRIESHMRRFEYLTANKQFNEAKTINNDLREKAKNQKNEDNNK